MWGINMTWEDVLKEEPQLQPTMAMLNELKKAYPYLKSNSWNIFFNKLYHSNRLIKSYTRGHAMDTNKMAALEKEALTNMIDEIVRLNNRLVQEQPKNPRTVFANVPNDVRDTRQVNLHPNTDLRHYNS